MSTNDDTNGNEGDGAQKQRSRIAFPYTDLNNAVTLAKALHGNAGYGCTSDQLAAFLGMTSSGGGFRLSLSGARMFGLIETDRGGEIRLTELGSRIIDPDQEQQARVDAFLSVELYRAIYEKFRGKLLPPRKGLDREIETLGVSSKQKERARQAFERSAEQAGFFSVGEDRLTMPVTRRGSPRPAVDNVEPIAAPVAEPPRQGPNLHPFILGLLESLPEPGASWKASEQVKWLSTAAGIFGLLYKGDGGEIAVSLKRAQAIPLPPEAD